MKKNLRLSEYVKGAQKDIEKWKEELQKIPKGRHATEAQRKKREKLRNKIGALNTRVNKKTQAAKDTSNRQKFNELADMIDDEMKDPDDPHIKKYYDKIKKRIDRALKDTGKATESGRLITATLGCPIKMFINQVEETKNNQEEAKDESEFDD